jgi:hypothetical protein
MSKRYKLLKGSHGKREKNGRGVVYKPGDILELTEREAEILGGRVELLGAAPTSDAPELLPAETEAKGNGLEPILAQKWSAVAKHIRELDSSRSVRALRDVEAEDRKRPSVLEAADARLAELGG